MTEQGNNGQTIIVNQIPKRNGMGTAGFVLALISIVFSWAPFIGWVTWVLGLIFSFVGIFREPKGLAIAGLILSLIGVIAIILFATVLASALAFM